VGRSMFDDRLGRSPLRPRGCTRRLSPSAAHALGVNRTTVMRRIARIGSRTSAPGRGASRVSFVNPRLKTFTNSRTSAAAASSTHRDQCSAHWSAVGSVLWLLCGQSIHVASMGTPAARRADHHSRRDPGWALGGGPHGLRTAYQRRVCGARNPEWSHFGDLAKEIEPCLYEVVHIETASMARA
jgi:hypothetical protein